MPNIHQWGNALPSVVADAISYPFRIERGGNVSDEILVRQSPSMGELGDGESVSIYQHVKTIYIPVDVYVFPETVSTVNEPIVGDILIDIDNNNRRWRVVPQDDRKAFSFHGSSEFDYQIFVKLD